MWACSRTPPPTSRSPQAHLHRLLLFPISFPRWSLLLWSRNLASSWIYTNAYFLSLLSYQYLPHHWICTPILTIACLFYNKRKLFLLWPLTVVRFLSFHYHQTSVDRNIYLETWFSEFICFLIDVLLGFVHILPPITILSVLGAYTAE